MKKTAWLLVLLLLTSLAAGAAAEEAAFRQEDILIDAGDHQIPATLTFPLKGEGPFPAVVMLHGNGSNRHEAGGGYDLMAPKFAENGIASLRIDYIGNGDSQTDYLEFTHEKGVEDALKAYDPLLTLPEVDKERIGVMGWSQGGGIALVAASRQAGFKSVLTWAGANYDGTIDEAAYETAKKDGFYLSESGWRDPLKLSPAYFEVLKAFIVADAVPLIEAPILAINGLLVDVVPPETAQAIIDLSGNEASGVLLLEGADHTFNIFTGDMTVFNELMDATLNWFQSTL